MFSRGSWADVRHASDMPTVIISFSTFTLHYSTPLHSTPLSSTAKKKTRICDSTHKRIRVYDILTGFPPPNSIRDTPFKWLDFEKGLGVDEGIEGVEKTLKDWSYLLKEGLDAWRDRKVLKELEVSIGEFQKVKGWRDLEGFGGIG